MAEERIIDESNDPVVKLARFIVKMMHEDLNSLARAFRKTGELINSDAGRKAELEALTLPRIQTSDTDMLTVTVASILREPTVAKRLLEMNHDSQKRRIMASRDAVAYMENVSTLNDGRKAIGDKLAEVFGDSMEIIGAADPSSNANAYWAIHAELLSEHIKNIKEFERLCAPLGYAFTSDDVTAPLEGRAPVGLKPSYYN